MTEVTLNDVTKNFGSITALSHVNFTAASQKLLGIVGPSGCGKTTTLRIVAGLEQPSEGDILFNNKSVLSIPPQQRNTGIVFQNYALFPHLTVEENVGYGLKFRDKFPRKNVRVEEILDLVGLGGFEQRNPASLSAGQQQRVALARAIAPRPKLLLLDEPLSALDMQLRDRLKLEIQQIQRALSITALYVTHNQQEALSIADKIVVMKEGTIEQIGPPPEIYNRPRTKFVASFIGKGNFFTGKVSSVNDEAFTAEIPSLNSKRLTIPYSPGDPPRRGQEVNLFLRPENVVLTEEKGIDATIVGREYLGDSLFLHLKTDQKKLLARVSPRQISSLMEKEVDQVTIQLPPHKILPIGL